MLLICSYTLCIAQNITEVVYLKNGGVIRGIIIEEVPDVSIKIQTSNGSVFAYQMSEIERISKEEIKSRTKILNNTLGNKTGYKGFADLGFTIGIGKYGENRFAISTSHGYQFNPNLFTGLGIGANYYLDSKVVSLPIFAHIRGNFLNNNISPFIDLKIGYSVLDVEGFFMVPSLGCKIGFINVGIEYVMQKVEVITGASAEIDTTTGNTVWFYETGIRNCGGINLKIGFEF